ncbi:MAG: T9SS type A sorting domain-containing protein [Sphingobacteriia bacterium]|nr:T9SS type A sorting domain-containing protein [Sphingobacteriia bacterium]
MKSIFTSLLLFMTLMTSAQSFSILFVNDNRVNSSNTSLMLDNLTTAGYDYTIFDCAVENRTPTAAEMGLYSLVIWYCSSDGVGLQLWNGNDTDNAELMAYLENGGLLWLMGTDMLYDRYTVPTTFGQGEFAYDYLGIKEYAAQAYGDDGGLGVPQLDVQPTPVATLSPITWMFTTAWWVDGIVGRTTAQPVYKMGPESYALSQYYSAIRFDSTNTRTVSFFFDPSIMDSDAHRVELMQQVIGYFMLTIGIDQQPSILSDLTVYPQPASKESGLIIKNLPTDNLTTLKLSSVSGQTIISYCTNGESSYRLSTDKLAPGLYLLTASNGKTTKTLKVTIY